MCKRKPRGVGLAISMCVQYKRDVCCVCKERQLHNTLPQFTSNGTASMQHSWPSLPRTLHTCTASSLDTHTSITGRCTRCTLPPAHTLALGRPHYACTVWPLNAFQFAPHWSAQHARMWTIAPPPPRFTVTSGAARVKCKCLPETREPSNVAKVKRRTVMVTAFLKTCRKRGLHRHSPTRYFSSLSSSSAFSSGLSLSSRFRSEGPHNRLFTSGRAIALGQPKNDLRPTALVCVDRDIY